MIRLPSTFSTVAVGALLLLSPARPATGGERLAWFVDGYHGGVYGHYPPGYTSFLVEQLAKHPEWKLNLEIEPETWDVARAHEPEAYAAFKKLAESPGDDARIEFVNPSYAQSYFFQSSGESVIRQFDHGIRKMLEHFPDLVYTTYSSEEPCFTSCLPPVLKSFGFEFAVLKNPNTCWGGYTSAYGGELVNWIGPDGTAILTVPRYACESLHPEDPWQTIASGNSPEYIQACFDQGIAHPVGMCLQDAGWRGGPWLKWSARNHYQPSGYILWSDYFRRVTAGQTEDDWKFSQEDVRPGLMWGAQVLQRMAQQSRTAEHQLLVAEKLSAMARIDAGRPGRVDAFDEAWHGVLLSQHHDCWVVPYNGRHGNTWADQVRRWTQTANAASDLATATALEALLHGRGRGRAVRLFNPTSAVLDTVVPVPIRDTGNPPRWISRDAKGRAFATQVVESETAGESTLLVRATLPALGYTTVELHDDGNPGTAPVTARETSDSVIVESDLYRIEFNPARGGTIRSLKVKELDDREFVDSDSARLFNELRGHFYDRGGFHSSSDQRAEITIVENGPLRATVEIAGSIAGHPFTQRVSLTQGSPVIDCSVRIDWQGNPRIGEHEEREGWGNLRRPAYDDRFKLLAHFPTPVEESTLTKNAPFDICESRLEDSFYNSWDKIKHNLILDWVDLGNSDHGLTLFSDHTTSYAHGPDHPLALTLQYAGKGLWARDYRVEGPTAVRYALVPHAGRWDAAGIPHLSAAWQEPPLGRMTRGSKASQRSLLDLSEAGWQVPAMFEREGSVYLRLFNSHGDGSPRKVRLGFGAGKAELVELDGRVLENLALDDGNSFTLAIPRLGFRTLRLTALTPPDHQ